FARSEPWPEVPRTMMRRICFLSLIALCLLTAGCYVKETSGDQTTYTFAAWPGILIIVGALLVAPIGLLVRQINTAFGWGLVVAGPLAAVAIGPAFFNDQVIVDGNHFEGRVGFWFAPTRWNIAYGDIRAITVVEKVEQRGTRTSTSTSL